MFNEKTYKQAFDKVIKGEKTLKDLIEWLKASGIGEITVIMGYGRNTETGNYNIIAELEKFEKHQPIQDDKHLKELYKNTNYFYFQLWNKKK